MNAGRYIHTDTHMHTYTFTHSLTHTNTSTHPLCLLAACGFHCADYRHDALQRHRHPAVLPQEGLGEARPYTRGHRASHPTHLLVIVIFGPVRLAWVLSASHHLSRLIFFSCHQYVMICLA